MAHATEPLITQHLWSWLEQQGHTVVGEVQVENGRVDLAAKTPDGAYFGYEVKDQRALERDRVAKGNSEQIRNLMKKLNRYQNSNVFDRLYFCSQEPGPIAEAIEQGGSLIDMTELNEALGGRPPLERDLTQHNIEIPQEVGVIRMPVFEDDEPEVVRQARQLHRTREPALPRTNEAWVTHRVWEQSGMLANRDWLSICEGTVPNPDGNTVNRLDILVFDGEVDTTAILRNQGKYGLIGVEAKGAGLGSGNHEDVREQLKTYLASGGMTQLYLAVPAKDAGPARELLGIEKQATIQQFGAGNAKIQDDDLSNIGLLTVHRDGDVTIVRSADQLDMEYDGICARDTGQQCKAVGWGKIPELRDPAGFDSVFEQEDRIHQMARDIDLSKTEWQTPLGKAVQKVQGGGTPTEGERDLIERRYERQFGK